MLCLSFVDLLMNVSENTQNLVQLSTTSDPEFICFGDKHVMIMMTFSFFL